MSTFMELILLEARKDFSEAEIEMGDRFHKENMNQIILKAGIMDDDHRKIYAAFCVRAYENDYLMLIRYFQLACEMADEAARKYQDVLFTKDSFSVQELENFLGQSDIDSLPYSMKKILFKAASIRRAIYSEVFHHRLEEYTYTLS